MFCVIEMNYPLQKRKVEKMLYIKTKLLKARLHFEGSVSVSRCFHCGPSRLHLKTFWESQRGSSVGKMLVTQA